jgi:ribose transport system ATP-binding protein
MRDKPATEAMSAADDGSTLTQVGKEEPLLVLKGISKSFGGERALRDASFFIRRREVHGLLGENGSGKSTLIKILSGYHVPDDGELWVRGRRIRLPLHPGQFRELGLSFVHQDLGLILRIAELGHRQPRWRVSWKAERRRASELFDRYDLALDPASRIGDLTPIERALLAIVRAFEGLSDNSNDGLLVLDEPTVFLPRADVDRLFVLIRRLVAAGASVLFVSHDLDEVGEITDTITVLRDGQVIDTVCTGAVTRDELIGLIVGRDVAMVTARPWQSARARRQVRVTNLSGSVVRGVSFDLAKGEIVGLTGLLGSGADEIPYLLFGAKHATGGTVAIDAAEYDVRTLTPRRALDARIALLPADRQRDGSIGSLPLGDNLSMLLLGDYFNGAWLRRRKLDADMTVLCKHFDIRPPVPSLVYETLSGGNQQKALVAKWSRRQPALFLLHEPTQGVDIGARQHILRTIIESAGDGMAVLCASSDHEQLVAICDRVLVFALGRLRHELRGDEITKQRIAECSYATGVPS